jgi:hypothetical protein
VDAELEKQRAKETAELQRRLKNRRNKAKSEKDLAVQEEVKVADAEAAVALAGLQERRTQIAGLLAQSAAPAEDAQPKAPRKRADAAATGDSEPGAEVSAELARAE